MAEPLSPNPTLNNTFTPTLTKRIGHGGPISPTEHDATIAGLEAKIAELVDHVEKIKTGEYLKTDAIDTAHLTNLKVTTDKLADLSVTGAKIANDTVTGTQLSNIADVAGEYTAGQVKLTVDGQGRVSGTEVTGSTTQADGLFDIETDYTADPAQGLTWVPIDNSSFPAYSLGAATQPTFDTLPLGLGVAGIGRVRLPSPYGKYNGGAGYSGSVWETMYFNSGNGYTYGLKLNGTTSKVLKVQFGPYIPDNAKAVMLDVACGEATVYYAPLATSYLPTSNPPGQALVSAGAGSSANKVVVVPLMRDEGQVLTQDMYSAIETKEGGNWPNTWLSRFWDLVTGDVYTYQELRDTYRLMGAAVLDEGPEGLGDYSWNIFCPAKPYVPLVAVSNDDPNNDTFTIPYLDLLGYWV